MQSCQAVIQLLFTPALSGSVCPGSHAFASELCIRVPRTRSQVRAAPGIRSQISVAQSCQAVILWPHGEPRPLLSGSHLSAYSLRPPHDSERKDRSSLKSEQSSVGPTFAQTCLLGSVDSPYTHVVVTSFRQTLTMSAPRAWPHSSVFGRRWRLCLRARNSPPLHQCRAVMSGSLPNDVQHAVSGSAFASSDGQLKWFWTQLSTKGLCSEHHSPQAWVTETCSLAFESRARCHLQ